MSVLHKERLDPREVMEAHHHASSHATNVDSHGLSRRLYRLFGTEKKADQHISSENKGKSPFAGQLEEKDFVYPEQFYRDPKGDVLQHGSPKEVTGITDEGEAYRGDGYTHNPGEV